MNKQAIKDSLSYLEGYLSQCLSFPIFNLPPISTCILEIQKHLALIRKAVESGSDNE
jgi:hypothetical protein